jgi:predicted GNAT family acetyltransferase
VKAEFGAVLWEIRREKNKVHPFCPPQTPVLQFYPKDSMISRKYIVKII